MKSEKKKSRRKKNKKDKKEKIVIEKKVEDLSADDFLISPRTGNITKNTEVESDDSYEDIESDDDEEDFEDSRETLSDSETALNGFQFTPVSLFAKTPQAKSTSTPTSKRVANSPVDKKNKNKARKVTKSCLPKKK